MRGKRMLQTIRMYLTLNVGKRTKYLKENHVFAAMGDNCSIMDRKIPLYANLIRFGNNVHVASKVSFITHDITHVMMNHCKLIATNSDNMGGGIRECQLYRYQGQCLYWL